VFARTRGISWDDYQRVLQPQFHSFGDVIRRDPGAVAMRMVKNFFGHLRSDATILLGWPMTVCTLIGAVLAVRAGWWPRLWPLAVLGVLLHVVLIPVFYSERYALPQLPLYATLAAAAFASPAFAMAFGPARRVWLKPAIALIPIGLALQASITHQRRVLEQQPFEIADCAETLHALARPGEGVIARKPHIAEFAGVPSVAFPFTETLPALADYAREHGAKWIFFSLPEVETRPSYSFLLDTTAHVPGLIARRVTSPRPAVLYEIVPGFGALPAWFANDTLRRLYRARAQAMATPNDWRTQFTVGKIELERGMLGEARVHLELAAGLSPRDPDLLLPLGEVMLRSGELDKAALAYSTAEALSPGNVEARVGRGWVSLVAGRPQEAAALWRPVIGLTTNVPTLARMVDIYTQLGDTEAAALARATLAKVTGGR
jgi:tetratricopeptide (TPR) repeat protein